MKVRVRTSRTKEFSPGEEFNIIYVYARDEHGPLYFDIFIPDGRYGDKASAFCRRDDCEHLGNGQWAIIF